jgi:3-methylcrotonyl-CoA carboxylase alpha subunit
LAQDGWRVGERARRQLTFRSGVIEKTIAVQYRPAGWELGLDEVKSVAQGHLEGGTRLMLELESGRRCLTVVHCAATEHVFMEGRHYALTRIDPLTISAAVAAGPTGLRSPMPGRVIELLAAVGSEVVKGQALLVLEAMKIEHTISAPGHGILRAFKVTTGEQVGEGVELVDFVPTPSA